MCVWPGVFGHGRPCLGLFGRRYADVGVFFF